MTNHNLDRVIATFDLADGSNIILGYMSDSPYYRAIITVEVVSK